MKGGQTFPITNISYEDTNKYKNKADEGINIKKKLQIKYKWTALDVWIVDIVVTDNERRSDISKYIKYSFAFCET